MTERKFQLAFVELLKNSIPSHLNLAEELSSRMSMSLDSVYRRLRCETDFSLEETMSISAQFNISITHLLTNESNLVSFRANSLNTEANMFAEYLRVLHEDLSWISHSPEASVTYAAEDLPVFYHFFFPELARFKMVYWNKSILNVHQFQGLSVEDVILPATWISEIAKVRESFLNIPSIEIWHEDTLKSTIKQIQFYWAAGYFKERQTILNILQELEGLIEMVKKQAENGLKYNPITKEFSKMSYTLYSCDLMIGNNCVFLKSVNKTATYLGYNSFNFIQTKNDAFNIQVDGWLNNLMSKSDMVSQISERVRNQFFRSMQSNIDRLKTQI